MQIESHSLTSEFPEFKDAIHTLKQSSSHFSKLFDEYHDADHLIRRAENGIEHMGDVALENLKKVRLSLKDQLFQLIRPKA